MRSAHPFEHIELTDSEYPIIRIKTMEHYIIVYTVCQYVCRTCNRGKSWEILKCVQAIGSNHGVRMGCDTRLVKAALQRLPWRAEIHYLKR